MTKVYLNNQEIEVQPTATILEAAKSTGVKIPTLCYLEGKAPLGACRVCLVEVEGAKTLVAACRFSDTAGRDALCCVIACAPTGQSPGRTWKATAAPARCRRRG